MLPVWYLSTKISGFLNGLFMVTNTGWHKNIKQSDDSIKTDIYKGIMHQSVGNIGFNGIVLGIRVIKSVSGIP